jgi:hypothetical protein
LVARGEYLWRLAQLAEYRYFFRFSFSDVKDAEGLVFAPSRPPPELRVEFSRKACGTLRSDSNFYAALAAVVGDFPAASLFDYVDFKRARNGVLVNTAPLRAGAFVLHRHGGVDAIVQLAALVQVPGASAVGYFVGYLFVPCGGGAASRAFEWAGQRCAGSLADVLGKVLTFEHPAGPSKRYFHPPSCEYMYM